jgi:hypothetical protein
MKIKIPAENYESLSRKITALNNKAEKLGLDEITLDIKYVIGEAIPDKKNIGLFKEQEYFQIEVLGEPPVLDGWKFVGIIEPTELGNILIEIRNDYPIPDKYRHTDLCDCEHCGIKRDRNTAFVVMNEETKQFLQVGRVCLKSYTSDTDPKNIALYESFFKLREFETKILSERVRPMYSSDNVLAFYLKGIELYPERRSNMLTLATGSLSHFSAGHDYYNEMVKVRRDIYAHLDDSAYEKAAAFKQSILNLDDTNNNKIWNYKIVLQEKYTANPQLVIESVEFKEAYDNRMTLEAKRMAEQMERLRVREELLEKKKLRSTVGVLNEKGVFQVYLERTKFIRNDLYSSMLYTFRDKDDNNIVCFHGGKDLFTQEEEKNLIENKTMFYLQGTVKEFSKYDEEPQTKLKSIKFLGFEPPQDKPVKAKKVKLNE